MMATLLSLARSCDILGMKRSDREISHFACLEKVLQFHLNLPPTLANMQVLGPYSHTYSTFLEPVLTFHPSWMLNFGREW